MKVSAETKRATQSRIFEVCRRLFARKGFEKTTTRDIAREAKIATGTLFNYFPTKESIALALLGETLKDVPKENVRGRHGNESLDELLFAHIAAGLRRLKPHRKLLKPVLHCAIGQHSNVLPAADEMRVRHMDVAQRLIAEHTRRNCLSPTSLHLYWTLYSGILSFWSQDSSPNQEDTLVLMDHWLKLFVSTLPVRKKPFDFAEGLRRRKNFAKENAHVNQSRETRSRITR